MAGSFQSLVGRLRSGSVTRAAGRAVVGLIPDIPWTKQVPTIGPVRFRLRRHRWMMWEEFATGHTRMLGVFDRLVRDGDVVYDIGANIGYYMRILAGWFHASQVVSFEPMRENVELLEANVALGKLEERVRVFGMALSDASGEEALQIDNVMSSTAVLDRVSGGEASEGRKMRNLPPMTETVRVARLDDVVAEHGLAGPDVVKIDTEGAEALVLAGGMETITKFRPRLTIAMHGPTETKAVFELLAPVGYVLYGFVKGEDGGPVWKRLSAEDGGNLHDNNIIASCDEDEVREELRRRDPGPRCEEEEEVSSPPAPLPEEE
jgi:FkbM family methyltransferase